jgi:hypothetical protein
MKKKWGLFVICLLVFISIFYLGISAYIHEASSRKVKSTKIGQKSFFVSVPIEKFNAADLPCLSIQMNLSSSRQ